MNTIYSSVASGFSGIRLSSLLIVAMLRLLPPDLYSSLFFAFLFCHYLLAFVSAKRQLRYLASDSAKHGAVVILTCATALATVLALPSISDPVIPFMIFYFGIHHAFTDVYSLNRSLDQSSESDCSTLIAPRLALNLSIYGVLFWNSLPLLNHLDAFIGYVAVSVSVVVFSTKLWAIRRSLPTEKGIDLVAFELIGLGVVSLLGGKGRFIDVIFYHLVYWLIYRFRETRRNSPKVVLDFAAKNVLWTGLFFLFTPWVHLRFSFGTLTWQVFANTVGFLHVSSTFATSRMNPRLITGMFSRAPEPNDATVTAA